MAKWTIEIDTDNVSSVVSVKVMLDKLLDVWEKTLRIPEELKEEGKNDTSPVSTTLADGQSETANPAA